MKAFKIAAAIGILAASLSGAAFAQDASGAMAPSSTTSDSSQPAMTPSTPMAPSADTSAANSNATASVDHTTVTNGPVPDTAANRAKYGAPMSHAGKKTKPAGN